MSQKYRLTPDQQALILKTNGEDLLKVFKGSGFTRVWLRNEKRRLESKLKPELRVNLEFLKQEERLEKSLSENRIKGLMHEIKTLRTNVDALTALDHDRAGSKITRQAKTKKHEAAALIAYSDWHIEERVRTSDVNSLNEYTLEIAAQRNERYWTNAAKLITKEAQDVALTHAIVFLGGDLITGNIHEENLETCALGPIEAAIKAQNFIIGGLEYLLSQTKLPVTVITAVGNHARITKRTHFSTRIENNIETFVYNGVGQHFRNNDSVTVLQPHGYLQFLDVFGFVGRFHHGDGIGFSGGVGGITVPVNKAISQWDIAQRASFDVFGHFHQLLFMPKFICNGSGIGYNAYAQSNKFSYESPQQAFCLIDSRDCMTIRAPIRLA